MLVIDACGAGALPDAADYGDEGTNTLSHLAAAAGGLRLPVMGALGLGAITEIEGVPPSADPAVHGRLAPLGPGQGLDHRALGADGRDARGAAADLPRAASRRSSWRGSWRRWAREVICNRPDNGLAAIEQFGEEHVRSGALILYTSQDSVAQLAAHVDVVSEAELYELCARAREVLSGPDGVGRVIARPFTGRRGAFERTPGRRDLPLAPPARSYLEEIERCGSAGDGRGQDPRPVRRAGRDELDAGRDERAGARLGEPSWRARCRRGSRSRT